MVLPLKGLEDLYEFMGQLGEGGMGAVYLVRHRLLDQIRVVKVMRAQLKKHPEGRARFLREAKIAVRLEHPNIARVYDCSIDRAGTAFLVMEYVEGIHLFDLTARFGVPEIPLALDIARQSLAALRYLHSLQIVHRDIAPDNIMLTKTHAGEPLVKLIDLGIAKPEVGDAILTHSGLFVGKVQYASPEQLSAGERKVDARSDLYSFGIVLYQLLTGVLPVRGDDPSAIMAGHLVHPPRPFSESDPAGRIPGRLRSLVMTALEKDPDLRYPSAEQFAIAIDALDSDGVCRTRGELTPEITVTLEAESMVSTSAAAVPAPHADASSTPPPHAPPPTPGGKVQGRQKGPSGVTTHVENLLRGAERLLRLGQGDAAKIQLDAVFGLDPDNEPARQMIASDQRLRALYREELLAELDDVLAEVAELRLEDRLDEAAERLRRALDMDPDNEALGGLFAEIESVIRKRDDARRKEELIKSAVREIRELMDTGDLAGAEQKLRLAQERVGGTDQLRLLELRLQNQMTRERRRKAQEALDAAASLLHEERLDEAIVQLESVLQVDEGNASARQLLEDARLRRDRSIALQQEVRALQEEASQLLAQGLVARTVGKVHEGLLLLPQDRGCKGVLAEAEGASQRRLAELGGAVEGVVADVAQAIRERSFDGARTRLGAVAQDLEDAVERLGNPRGLHAGRARVSSLQAELDAAEVDALRVQADLDLANGHPDRAVEALEKALALAPNTEAVARGLDDARVILERRQAEAARHQALVSAVARADQLLASGQVDEAEQVVQRAKVEHGPTAELEALTRGIALARRLVQMVEQARRLLADGDPRRAVVALERALALDPANSAAQQGLAPAREALLRLESEEARQRALDQLQLEVEGLVDSERLGLAQAALDRAAAELGQLPEIEALRTRVVRLQGERKLAAEVAALQKKAEEMLAAGEPAAAVEHLERALHRSPDSASLRALLDDAQAALARQHQEHRLAAVVAALEVEAERLEARGLLEQAAARLEEALALTPHNHPVAVHLAALQASVDRQREAEERDQAVVAVLRDTDIMAAAGRFEEALTRLKEAVASLGTAPELEAAARSVLNRRRQKVASLVERAMQAERGDQLGDATLLLEKAAEVDPADDSVRHRLDAARSALAAQRQQRRLAAEAAELLDEAARLEARGLVEQATARLEEALALTPADRPTQERLVALRIRLEQEREADQRAKALAVVLRDVDALCGAGRFQGALNRVQEARARLGDASELEGAEKGVAERRAEAVAGWASHARQLQDAGDFEGAIAALERAVALDRADRGLKRQLDGARKALSRQRDTQRQAAEVKALLEESERLERRGLLEQAVARLEQAVALVPDDATSAEQLTAARSRLAEQHEAEERARSLAAATREVETLTATGCFEEALGRVELARRELGDSAELRVAEESVVGRRREELERLVGRARELAATGQPEDAIPLLQRAASLDPAEKEAAQLLDKLRTAVASQHGQQGRALGTGELLAEAERLEQLGFLEQAVSRLQKVVAFAPDDAEAGARLSAARARLERQREEAKRQATIAVAVREVDLLATAGSFAEALARCDEARQRLGELPELAAAADAVLERRRSALDSLLQRADKLASAGTFDEAVALLERALTVDPADDRAASSLERARRALANQRQEQRRAAEVAALLEDAERLDARGLLEQALARLEEAQALEPGDLTLRRRVAAACGLLEEQRCSQEREEAVAAAVRKVEALAAAGAFGEAVRQFQAANERLGGPPELAAAAEGVVAARQAALASLVQRAGEHFTAGRMEDGIALLEKAAALDPGDADLARRLVETRASVAGQREAQRRAAEVEALLEEAGRLEERGLLVPAVQRLEEAAALAPGETGVQERLVAVRARLEQTRQAEQRAEALAGTLREADALAAAGSFVPALEHLDQARRELGEAPEFAAAAATVANRQREAVDSLLGRAQKTAAAGKLEEAVALLEKAVALDPGRGTTGERLEEARARLAAAREERRRTSEAADLNVEAERLVDSGLLEQASARLEQALALTPGDRKLEKRLAVVRSRFKEERRGEGQARAMAAATRDAETLAAAGSFAEALERLGRTREQLGEAPELAAAAASVTQARAEAVAGALGRARQLASAGDIDQAATLLARAAALDPDHPTVRETRAELSRARLARPKPAASAAPAPGREAAAVASKPAQAPSTLRRMLLPLAAVIILAAAGGGFLAARGSHSGKTAGAAPTPAAVRTGMPQPATGTGVLVVDARPWAYVDSVVDAAGREMPLPADRSTPLHLTLPGGQYQVALSRPGATPMTRPAEVVPGEKRMVVGEFR